MSDIVEGSVDIIDNDSVLYIPVGKSEHGDWNVLTYYSPSINLKQWSRAWALTACENKPNYVIKTAIIRGEIK